MKIRNQVSVEEHFISDDGIFPNSRLPVLIYKNVLRLPRYFKGFYVRQLFIRNKWSNSWKSGIFEYHHYHSISHEALGVIKGKTSLLLGGPKGIRVEIEKGDVVIIPAGVAHKNEGKENDVICIGAYPEGGDYDIKYGREGERSSADNNIRHVPLPETDPVYGQTFGVRNYWK